MYTEYYMTVLPIIMNINEKGKHLPFANVCVIMPIYVIFCPSGGDVIVKHGFPLYIDLNGNNCTVFGGGEYAADKVETLLKFGAKVTVISPSLCERLTQMDAEHRIRYIPRKYYRSDCTTSVLCVAATDDDAVNIAIATESKAKNIPVHVSHPAAFGNFLFPEAILTEHVQISLVSDGDVTRLKELRDRIETIVAEYEE